MTNLPPSTPKRIQRKRIRGWRMPPNAIYVGRPTKWGNPFRIGKDGSAADCVEFYRAAIKCAATLDGQAYNIRAELRGKDLACFCPLDQPCHADVLLEIANAD